MLIFGKYIKILLQGKIDSTTLKPFFRKEDKNAS